MKHILSVLYLLVIVLTGCVTVPEQSPDEYLSDMTREHQQTLAKIEQDIPAKKAEVDEAKMKLAAANRHLDSARDREDELNEKINAVKDEIKRYMT